jgi:hypothetical protein
MKKFFYMILLAVMMLVFLGCKKSSEIVEPDTSLKVTQLQTEVTLSVPENICAGQEFTVKVSVNNGASGKLQLLWSADNGSSWKKAAETKECKEENEFYLTRKSGSYLFKAGFDPAGCSGYPEGESGIIERKVTECLDCDEILIEPDLSVGSFIVKPGELITFTAEYNITACDDDYKELVLQGGLIAGAVYKSSFPEGAEVKFNNKNTIIEWNIGDVELGFSKRYKVTFDYLIPAAESGTHIPLTGGFIVQAKTAEGLSVRTGDYNEIFIQVE